MALTKGVNSYCTVAEGDAHFADRLDSDIWSDATSTRKSQALITATATLDELLYIGVAVDESQTLAFPKVGTYFDPKLGMNIELSGVPDRIIKATFELSKHFLTNEDLLNDEGTVKDMRLGDISMSNIRSAGVIPPSVKRLIQPLLENSGGNLWWRAN